MELREFKPASIDDIASVHTRNYVTGLEKVLLEFFSLYFLIQVRYAIID